MSGEDSIFLMARNLERFSRFLNAMGKVETFIDSFERYIQYRESEVTQLRGFLGEFKWFLKEAKKEDATS